MLNGWKVADVDMHIVEPPDLWQRYMNEAFAKEIADNPKAPKLYLSGATTVSGQLTSKSHGSNQYSAVAMERGQANVRRWYGDLVDMGWTAEAQLLGMEREGIDVAFLYPTRALYILARDGVDPTLALAVARAYNDWLYDFCSHAPDRLRHVAMVPPQNPEGAVDEVRRCKKEYGSWGVFMRGEPHDGRILDDPAYEPLWYELEELDMALGLHHSTHAMVPTLGAHRFQTRLQSHTLSHPMEQMANLVAFIGSGVLERHPNLRLAFLESGGGWLPYTLWRFDKQFEELAFEAPTLTLKPSEYFRRQCWIAVEASEPEIGVLTELVGEDRLVISSDFPHVDHPPGEIREFAAREDVDAGVKQRTMWDNTMALYSVS